jgi:hypothetical protein
MKGFLWDGSKVIQGGKCLVARARVQRPLHLGVLELLTSHFMVGRSGLAGCGCRDPTLHDHGLACLLQLTR